MLEREIAFEELHASLAGHRERVFRLRSEIWGLVAGSRKAVARSQQLIADVEAVLARRSRWSPAKVKVCEHLDYTEEANGCFRLAESETHAGVRIILMEMGYGWLTLAHQGRQQ